MIRQLAQQDLAALRVVRLEALRLHPEAFSSSHEEESNHTLDDFVRFVTPPSATFGAFADDRLVGIAGLSVSPRLKQSHKGTLVGVYVRAESRREGFARQLAEAVVVVARQAKLRSLLLSVTVGNGSARQLYLNLGFRPFGLEPRALRVNGEFYDDELMALDLD
jgi:ribosomal protein S18 acetylase RimI-like enzyme